MHPVIHTRTHLRTPTLKRALAGLGFLSLSALLMLPQTATAAGWTLVQKVESDGSAPESMTMHYQDGRMRMDIIDGGKVLGFSMVNMRSGEITTVTHADKKAVVTNIAEMGKMVSAIQGLASLGDLAEDENLPSGLGDLLKGKSQKLKELQKKPGAPKLVQVKKNAKFKGITCDQYRWSGDKNEGSGCFTLKAKGVSFKDFIRDAKAFTQQAIKAGADLGQMQNLWMYDTGFPVVSEGKSEFMGQKTHFKAEMTSIKSVKHPKKMFEVPAGYKTTTMQQMMREGMEGEDSPGLKSTKGAAAQPQAQPKARTARSRPSAETKRPSLGGFEL